MKLLRIATLGLAISVSPVLADHIKLKDGSSIQGTITAIQDNTVIILTHFAGEIKVKQDQVVGLSSEEALSLKLDDGQKITGPIASSQAGSIKVDTGKGLTTSSIDKIDSVWAVGAEDPELAALRPRWKTSLGFDLAGKTGNSEQFSLATRVDSERSTPDSLLKLYAGVYQTENEGIETEERLLGGTRFDHYFSKTLGWYLREEIEQDKIKNLDLRTTTSLGFIYRLKNETNHKLSLRGGPGYQYESYTVNRNESSLIGDLGLNWYYDYRSLFQITSDLSTIPNFSNMDDFQIYHDTGINFPFKGQNWGLRIGVSNVYDNEPEVGKRELDTTYYTRLQFTWE